MILEWKTSSKTIMASIDKSNTNYRKFAITQTLFLVMYAHTIDIKMLSLGDILG